MKENIRIHNAIKDDIGHLITYRAMPTHSVNHLDPFLFLNHHGPQEFPPKNQGLPFGPHPHRGFCTLTFILTGDLVHKDSTGSESRIEAGGIQWMTAGKGIVHAEISSEEFKEKGGPIELLQLWINLPGSLKSIPPYYLGLQEEEVPKVENDAYQAQVICGALDGVEGELNIIDGLMMSRIDLQANQHFNYSVPNGHEVFCYLVRGQAEINGQKVAARQLIQFDQKGGKVQVKAFDEKAILLFGHGKAYEEPIVAQGPFVMNTREEIEEAYQDYRAGKFE